MNYRSIIKAALLGAALTVAVPAFSAWADAPQSGGTLHLAAPYGAALKSLDPHATYTSQDMVVSKAFHRSLYTWESEKNAPALDLARLVKISEDGKTFTYELFDNIYFHNGRKLTTDDVVWSYTRIMDPTKGYPGAVQVGTLAGAQEYAKGEAKEISGIKKIDDRTFSLTFKDLVDPGTQFFEAITAILPREEVESGNFLSHPVGLGPFKFESHVEGSKISGKKFDKYFKSGKPYADAVEFTISGDNSALDMAFRAGELDATVLSENAYVLYKADPELSKGLIELSEVFTRHMGMNTEKKPFDDVRVRQAINYAVDRDIIIRKLLKDKAYKATGWLPATAAAFDKERAPYPYDPAKAKQLLAQAGYPNGFEVTISVTEGTSSLGVLEAMMPFLKEVGITATAKVVDSNTLVDEMDQGKAMAWFRSAGTGPDSLNALRCFDSRVSRSGCNRSAFKDPAYDAILDEAAAEADPAKRVELLKKADGYIFEKAPVWFNNYNKAVVATQPWIHGVDANVTEAAIIEVDSLWLDDNAPGRQ